MNCLLDKSRLHFMALWGLALMLMLNWPEGYRTFIYLNLVIVVVHVFSCRNDQDLRTKVFAIAAIPLALTILHMLAAGRFEFIKEVRHIWLAAFTVLSVFILARRDMSSIKLWLPASLIILLVVYCLAEFVALTILDNPYGTNKNPHYLALYSALALALAICGFICLKNGGRYFMIPIALSLGYFVLHTSSRPAWVALVISALFVLFFLQGKSRLWMGFFVLTIPVFLFLTNVVGFGDRVSDLAVNIGSEERVILWQDAWRMQEASNFLEWFIGHGLGSYEEDFQAYSYYRELVNFNSPHNSFLEMLYTSGVIGLLACIWLYYWIYSRIWRLTKDIDQRKIAVLLMSIVTINLLFIMLTIPFISHYNIYTLAFVIGTIFYLRSLRHP